MGAKIASMPGHAQAPKAGAADILQRRFPVPRLVDCDQNGSQVLVFMHAMHAARLWSFACLCKRLECSTADRRKAVLSSFALGH